MNGHHGLHHASGKIMHGILPIQCQPQKPASTTQVYQRRITEAGGVDTLLTAMHRFVEFSMVQLSVILCLIPLALGEHAWLRSCRCTCSYTRHDRHLTANNPKAHG